MNEDMENNRISSLLDETLTVIQNTVTPAPTDPNIFLDLEIGNKEVLMCRALKSLLQRTLTDGTHLLTSFVQEVLNIPEWNEEWSSRSSVTTEWPIDPAQNAAAASGTREGNPAGNEEDESSDGARRIDIVISNAGYFIPIEAKIGAGDQKAQCFDYFHYAEQRNEERGNIWTTKIYYLTKDRHLPSLESRQGRSKNSGVLDRESIVCLSWTDDIAPWLKKQEEKANPALRNAMCQFAETIRKAAGKEMEQENIQAKITEMAAKDPDMLVSADAIHEASEGLKLTLIRAVFQEFADQIKEGNYEKTYGLTEMGSSDPNDFRKDLHKEYDHQYSTYPGLSYRVAEFQGTDKEHTAYEIWFRIDLEYRLAAGLKVVTKNGYKDVSQQVVEENEQSIYQMFPGLKEVCEPDHCWIIWRYPNGQKEEPTAGTKEDAEIPKFKKPLNHAAAVLIDPKIRHEKVSEYLSVFEDLFLKPLKEGNNGTN